MNYILSLPIRRASKLYKKAIEENKRKEAYQWWLARVPMYTKENYESFEEFYEKIYPPKVEYDTRSKDEIMSELLGMEV
ncbi:MAG: hypothetical protein L0J35_07095, partial [Tetragenococcus halophilus]|nr:hypothetical protein [Tetragenococcus halophilus]